MSEGPDVLFVNPGCQESVYQDLGHLTAIEPPQWCGLLATFLRNRGLRVAILDAEALSLCPHVAAAQIRDSEPALCCVVVYGHQPSASTQTMVAGGEICTALKELDSNIPTIMVGGHVTALPERTLREEDVSFVCNGEGPATIHALASHLSRGEPARLEDVPGLAWLEGDAFRITPAPPVISELDKELPAVAWDLLPMERYRAHNWHCFGDNIRQPYANLYTSLGCPYKCSFCCINTPFGKPSIRYRSPQTVIEEIGLLVNRYGVRNIKITDEMFVLKPAHNEQIADLIIERGYKVNIWAYARVDTVKPKYLEKLKRAGFNWLALGIESASEFVRDGVDKNFGRHDIEQVVKVIQEHGINVIGNYIFGLPDDDMESMQETLDMAVDLNCEFGNFYSAMAYPGSPLYTLAVEKGWALPETWSGFSQHSFDCLPLPTDKVSAGEVMAFRDYAFHKYFEGERYLGMVEKRFGLDTRKVIEDMTRTRLKRKYAVPIELAI